MVPPAVGRHTGRRRQKRRRRYNVSVGVRRRGRTRDGNHLSLTFVAIVSVSPVPDCGLCYYLPRCLRNPPGLFSPNGMSAPPWLLFVSHLLSLLPPFPWQFFVAHLLSLLLLLPLWLPIQIGKCTSAIGPAFLYCPGILRTAIVYLHCPVAIDGATAAVFPLGDRAHTRTFTRI